MVVRLTFDEPLRAPSVVRVTSARGARVSGPTKLTGRRATTTVDISTDGTFSVAYRVLSDDGHPVTGRLSFSVGTIGQSSDISAAGGVTGRVAGALAGLALLFGLGLLTIPRWAPGLWT